MSTGMQSGFACGRKQARFHKRPGRSCHVANRHDDRDILLRFSGHFTAMRQGVANFARQWIGIPEFISQLARQPVSVMSARFHASQ